MALNIRNKKTEELAAKLAQLTGETKTEAVRLALLDRLERIGRDRRGPSLAHDLREIGEQRAQLPILDTRSTDEILGYESHGLEAPKYATTQP